MDEEANDMHATQAPIVVDETETVSFEHKVEPDTKPEVVEEAEEPATEEVRGESCCDKFLRCLSHVPCASLIAWIILFMGLGGLTGSLLIGTYKTRELLASDHAPVFKQYRVYNTSEVEEGGDHTIETSSVFGTPSPDIKSSRLVNKTDSDGITQIIEMDTAVFGTPTLWFVELMLIGVVVSMLVLGTLFLLCGHLSTDPTSRRVFNSTTKNRCARGLNIFLLVFIYILTLLWMLTLLLLAVPVVLLVLLFLLKDVAGVKCIDLANYGFEKRDYCGDELDVFAIKARDVLVCFAACYFSALLIIISLIHFLISISANITHLKDNRFVTLNAYEPEEHSKHSVLDTNM